MDNSIQPIQFARLCFALVIGALIVCIIYTVYSTCIDIANCKDDAAVPTPQFRSASSRNRNQDQCPELLIHSVTQNRSKIQNI